MPILTPRSRLPQLVAAASGILVALVCLLAGLAVVASMEYARLRQVQSEAAVLISGMVSESRYRLREAEKTLSPDCSVNTLKTLRRWILSSEYISEFGILDEQGDLVCTTTDGLLQTPLVIRAPDVIYPVPRTGESFKIYYNYALEISEQGLMSSIAALSRFNVVVSPFKLRDLHAVNIDVIRTVLPDQKTYIAYQNPHVSNKLLARFDGLTHSFRGIKFDLESLSFFSSNAVPNTTYVTQCVLTLDQILQRNRLWLMAITVVALFVGMLVFLLVLQQLIRRASFVHRIPRLLKPENIVCMLQPIYNLKTGKLTGCELLMRLQDGGSQVYPDKIIPAVVERKLTSSFDRAVITRAALDLRLLNLPVGFKVALNFFPETFLSGQARQLLDEHFSVLVGQGVEVCLEVIEQQISVEIVDEVLALKEKGYLVSVDDFGTGFSNLGSVKSLGPHFIKIDRSFVHDMEAHTVRSTLIPEIIQIARAVGAEVVAEGIENTMQLAQLCELGAEYGQGFFLGKPITVGAFSELLRGEVFSFFADRTACWQGELRAQAGDCSQ